VILSIETSTEVCSVAIHDQGQLIGGKLQNAVRNSASILMVMIHELLEEKKIQKQALKAIAVSSGPGSYTGLRIGISSAKGLCFGLSIPLISVPTLDILIASVKSEESFENAYLIPMLDARRMEVYAQVNAGNQVIKMVQPYIIEEDTFSEFIDKPCWLIGPGAAKCKLVNKQKNIRFFDTNLPNASFMGSLAFQKFSNEKFEDLAYFEPFYLKEFQTKPAKKVFA